MADVWVAYVSGGINGGGISLVAKGGVADVRRWQKSGGRTPGGTLLGGG